MDGLNLRLYTSCNWAYLGACVAVYTCVCIYYVYVAGRNAGYWAFAFANCASYASVCNFISQYVHLRLVNLSYLFKIITKMSYISNGLAGILLDLYGRMGQRLEKVHKLFAHTAGVSRRNRSIEPPSQQTYTIKETYQLEYSKQPNPQCIWQARRAYT